MNKCNLMLAICLALFSLQLKSQTEGTSVYGSLITKRFYEANLSKSGSGSKTIYKVNGEKVDEDTYEKYHSAWADFESCCPCILQTYDINEVLLSEAVSCTDCLVGFYFEFYENGITKIKGQYKENPTGDWSKIFEKGYCSVKDGVWEYYNEQGEIASTEIWKNGDFVEQKPKGKKAEIWRVDLLVNNEKLLGNQLEMANLKTLEIIPQYKNEYKTNRLQAVISITTSNGTKKQSDLPITSLNAERLGRIVAGSGAKSGERLSMNIAFYDGDEDVQNTYLSVFAK